MVQITVIFLLFFSKLYVLSSYLDNFNDVQETDLEKKKKKANEKH